jgi:tetratricopeptide (TPR) repeat protein
LLESLEQLLKLFPEDGSLNLCRLGCLRELARREERLRILEQLCVKPGTDPVFWQQYAQELRADSREYRAAVSWIKWGLRYRPTDPAMVSVWADLLWDRRDFAKALPYYRLAACLGDKKENFSKSYFIASRRLRETQVALGFLREREERLGDSSADPTITLVESLQSLRETKKALQALEDALARLPEDGGLRLFASDFNGRLSQFKRAHELLDEARGRCSMAAWHRAAAALAGYQNDKRKALEHWRQVLELEPMSYPAASALSLLLAEVEGRAAAFRFLDEICEKFPCSCPLLGLRIRWLKEEPPEKALPHLRRLLEVNPADAWGWRELAIKLDAQNESAKALEAAQEGIRLEPNHSSSYAVRGELHFREGRLAEASADFREAVRLEIDNEYALRRFVETGATLLERKEALNFVAQELRRQVIFSGALGAFQNAARGLLKPDEVLELLREAHQARPDLWQSWSVLVHQRVDMGQLEEARQLALIMTGQFPFLPRAWVDLARVEQARLNPTEEIVALEKALELNPGYTFASRQLSEIYQRQHELDKARAVLEQAIAANPLEAVNHGCLAHVLWSLGERDAALARNQHAILLEPGYDWAWNKLREWGQQAGKPKIAEEMARELTRNRAGEARSWLFLARCLDPEKDGSELFKALDRALELNPRCEDAFDARARTLTRLNRFEEALAECAPAVFQPVPARLQIRGAWVEAQRGNLPGAIHRAQTALKEFPDYYGGWQLLADWHAQNKDLEGASEAAQRMTELAPLQPVPLGHLGNLKMRLGDHKAAKAAFERAFALDPDYEYAGFELFHLHVQAREWEAAEKTLKVLERRGGNHQTLSCAVQLAAARGQWDRALEMFEGLCASKDAEAWTLSQAAKSLGEQRHRERISKALKAQLHKPGSSTGLAVFWVEREAGRGRWGLHKTLEALRSDGEAGRTAVLRYLDLLGEAFQTAKRRKDVTARLRLRYELWRLLKKHREWLANDVTGWGKVGYVLTCIGRPRPAVKWLADWRKRPEAESWMLYNMVIMLQRLGRCEESRQVIRHAVSLRHSQELYAVFKAWAAFEEALLGNIDEAAKHLSGLPSAGIDEDLKPVIAMVRLLIELARKPGLSRTERSKMVRKNIRAGFGRLRPYKAGHYVRKGYRRFFQVVSRDSWSLRFWSWWFNYG